MTRSAAALLLCAGCSAPLPVSDGGAGPPDAGVPAADAGRPWRPSEVSFLFPLPTDGGDLPGVAGLLPPALFAQLGQPDAGLPRLVEAAGGRDLFPELRVVSARVDPCFDPGDGGCVPQVRLAAQTFDPSTGDVSDAAIHLFYALDRAAFVDLLAAIRAASRAAPAPPGLGPSPFADRLRAALLAPCSTANLTRFTFMATGRSKNWFFFVLDRDATGAFARSAIAGVGDADSFTDQGLVGYRMGIGFGVPWFPDALLGSPSTRALTEPEFAAAYDQLTKLQDPARTRTAAVNCAACHVAESTQTEALRDRDAGVPPAALRFGNLHAFSYFNGQPVVSVRTANETAEVLRALDAFRATLTASDRARLE